MPLFKLMGLLNKNCFIVTSAMQTRTDSSATIDRWLSTLHTIDSINARIKNAHIILVDMGADVMPRQFLDGYFPDNVQFVWLNNHPHVKQVSIDSPKVAIKMAGLYKIDGKTQEELIAWLDLGYIKNMTETWAINHILETHDLSIYENVFKLSGRYFLNDNFDIKTFKGPITFKPQGVRDDKSINFVSIMWGFKGSTFDKFKELWKNTYKYMLKQYNEHSKVIDIESSIYYGFNILQHEKDLIHFTKSLGVSGKVNNENNKIIKQ
jgi:hypothetical protein|tara:strand:+ start:2461 stop:3255 length:795 start_codon:yes stop_codon:yes gene_type:complete